MRSDSAQSRSVWFTPAALMATTFSSRHSAVAPRPRSRSTIASTSRMRGMLRSTTSSSVRSVAARAGRAAFLLPAGTTVPDSGWPPSMTNFSMREPPSRGRERLRKGSEGHLTRVSFRRAGYPARMPTPTRDEAWDLFCEWTESDSLRKHVLGVEAAMRAYAREYGEDEELWAATASSTTSTTRSTPTSRPGHPRVALELFEELDYPQELIDAVAGHAPYLGVPARPRWPRRCSPSTS